MGLLTYRCGLGIELTVGTKYYDGGSSKEYCERLSNLGSYGLEKGWQGEADLGKLQLSRRVWHFLG